MNTQKITQLLYQPKWAITTITILCLLFIELAVLPAMDYEAKLKAKIRTTTNRLEKLILLQKKIHQLQTETSKSPLILPVQSLFSLVENIARQSGVKGKIEFMRPVTGGHGENRGEQLEIRLKDIYLLPLTTFLTGLEKEPGVQISRISIRSRETRPGQLNVNLIITRMTDTSPITIPRADRRRSGKMSNIRQGYRNQGQR